MLEFPQVLDATILTTWKACRRRAKLAYMEHWKPKQPSVDLHAGGAYAHGLEAMRRAYYADGIDAERALTIGTKALIEFYGDFECPWDSPKNLARMAGALEYYAHKAWPLDTDPFTPVRFANGKLGIEWSYVVPLPIKHPTTGDPLLYSARADMVGNYAGGVFGLDDKTTKQLGPTWSSQWDLRSQFIGYTWASREYGVPWNGVVIRGTCIQVKQYNHAEAVVRIPDWLLDQWYDDLLMQVQAMLDAWLWEAHEIHGSADWERFAPNFSDSCTSYGRCAFFDVCRSRDQAPWLRQGFTRRIWDPVLRQEHKLEETNASNSNQDTTPDTDPAPADRAH